MNLFLYVFFISLSVYLTVANVCCFMAYRKVKEQNRQLERDRSINQLENQLGMNLPAIYDQGHRLGAVLGIVLAAWLREKYRR